MAIRPTSNFLLFRDYDEALVPDVEPAPSDLVVEEDPPLEAPPRRRRVRNADGLPAPPLPPDDPEHWPLPALAPGGVPPDVKGLDKTLGGMPKESKVSLDKLATWVRSLKAPPAGQSAPVPAPVVVPAPAAPTAKVAGKEDVEEELPAPPLPPPGDDTGPVSSDLFANEQLPPLSADLFANEQLPPAPPLPTRETLTAQMLDDRPSVTVTPKAAPEPDVTAPYREAMQRADRLRNLALAARTVAEIGAIGSGQKPNYAAAEDIEGLAKAAEQRPSELAKLEDLARTAQERREAKDPDSASNQNFRALVRGTFPKFAADLGPQFESLTRAEMEKAFPVIQRAFAQEGNLDHKFFNTSARVNAQLAGIDQRAEAAGARDATARRGQGLRREAESQRLQFERQKEVNDQDQFASDFAYRVERDAAKAEEADLTPAEIDAYAQVVGRTGVGSLTRMPPKQKAEVMLRAFELGFDPVVGGAEYKASTSALSQNQRMAANVEAFEQTVQENLGILKSASEAFDRTPWRFVNKPYIALQSAFGNDAALQFTIAAVTVASEYARVMQGQGTTTDAARAKAMDLLNTAMSAGNIETAIATMRQEMANRVKGFETVHKKIQGGIAAGANPPNPGSGSTPAPPPPDTTGIGNLGVSPVPPPGPAPAPQPAPPAVKKYRVTSLARPGQPVLEVDADRVSKFVNKSDYRVEEIR